MDMQNIISMKRKTKLQEILQLYYGCSARFSNYVLKSLIEEIGDKQNIALSPSRLQAVLVLLANWTTPNISRCILTHIAAAFDENLKDF